MKRIELYTDRLSTIPGDFDHYMKIPVLAQKGYVQFIEYMGSDYQIAKTAKMCFGRYEDRLDVNQICKTIQMLIVKEHMSPFEFAQITFKVKAPIFVARQWFRHRTFSYMERSGRYVASMNEFYDPFDGACNDLYTQTFERYDDLLSMGDTPENARNILPQSMFTEFLCSADLRNLLHFLQLRLSKGAQKEMREYATAIATFVNDLFPMTWKSFEEHVLYKNEEKSNEDIMPC